MQRSHAGALLGPVMNIGVAPPRSHAVKEAVLTSSRVTFSTLSHTARVQLQPVMAWSDVSISTQLGQMVETCTPILYKLERTASASDANFHTKTLNLGHTLEFYMCVQLDRGPVLLIPDRSFSRSRWEADFTVTRPSGVKGQHSLSSLGVSGRGICSTSIACIGPMAEVTVCAFHVPLV